MLASKGFPGFGAGFYKVFQVLVLVSKGFPGFGVGF